MTKTNTRKNATATATVDTVNADLIAQITAAVMAQLQAINTVAPAEVTPATSKAKAPKAKAEKALTPAQKARAERSEKFNTSRETFRAMPYEKAFKMIVAEIKANIKTNIINPAIAQASPTSYRRFLTGVTHQGFKACRNANNIEAKDVEKALNAIFDK
jgi:hypothetical protein